MKTSSAAMWLLLGSLSVVVVFAIYFNSLHNGFVFDDLDIVVGDPRIRNLHSLRALEDAYRPLRSITYALDYAVWGLRPIGFRLTNIAIHAANVVIVLLLARRLTGGALVASGAAALFFAVHPVQVESVAYISGRRDVLFTLFYLLAFAAFVRFREATTTKARVAWIIATALGFLLSLGSKEMAASFPLACGLWDVYRATAPDETGARPAASDALRRLAREGALLYAAGVVAVAVFGWYTIYVRGATTRLLGPDIEFWGGSPLNNALTVPLTFAHYAKLTVWPWTLAAQYYGAFDPASGFTDPRVVPAILFGLALLGVAVWLVVATRHRLVGFGILWFAVTLLPASQIIPHHEIVADHYLYLPLAGAGFALAGAIRAVDRRALGGNLERAVAVATVVVILCLAGRTIARNTDFRDEATLWEATYAAVPQSPRAAYNYGLVLTNRGDHARAIKLYEQAIDADPTFVKAYFNLASTYAQTGKFDEARAVYDEALRSDLEQSARTWHIHSADVLRAMYRTELAMLDAQSGRTEVARDDLATIVQAFPDLLRSEEFYGTVLQMRGELTSAIDDYRARADAQPDVASLRIILASLQWKAGRLEDAHASLLRAVGIWPDSCFVNFTLARFARDVRPGTPDALDPTARFNKAAERALTPFDAETVRRTRDSVGGSLGG